ncbi:hypothetical protein E2C01_054760 [Portunus trituberculatus]|uniref:Uncharacterized protein n=1 Tax=Portunus trituberculatus TaxID=210409 RepID=A0A5B7GVV8_PORTR|nr:hypothetical protein [Portunus trituberculatus]
METPLVLWEFLETGSSYRHNDRADCLTSNSDHHHSLLRHRMWFMSSPVRAQSSTPQGLITSKGMGGTLMSSLHPASKAC